jgi:SpoIID/LytB domain protein
MESNLPHRRANAYDIRTMSDRVSLQQWHVHSNAEPLVRIGVVLAEDAMTAIEFRLPGDEYIVLSDGGEKVVGKNVRVSAKLENNRVALAIGDQPAKPAAKWTIVPQSPRIPKRADGILVRDVVAGRGFHWQKHVDQTIAGALEILPNGDSLILVNELPLEMYLAGVITSEMSSKCPPEFLRAQCVTARSWLLAFTEPKHHGQPFDRCNDDCCQRYQGTGDLSDVATDAAESTRGLVLMAAGKVVDANYSKSCGGIVELPEHVWGAHKPGLGPAVDAPVSSTVHKFVPVTDDNLHEYLTGDWIKSTDVYCSPHVIPEDKLGQYLGRVDESGHYFRWTVKYTHEELLAMLKRKLPQAAEMTKFTDLRVTNRGVSGRAMRIVLSFLDASGKPVDVNVHDQYRIRQILHASFLFSSAFQVETERDAQGNCKSITLVGAGWGHGAGLCQIGALGMSICGHDFKKIVRQYFPEAELRKLYA